MLRTNSEKLEDLIVIAFSERARMTASELAEVVSRRHRVFSIQAIYQELRKLQDQQVVTKVNERYMLRVAWVLETVHLSDRIYENYVQRGAFSELLPAIGEKVSWRISSIARLTSFWAQINLALLSESEGKVLYEYLPHVWFHLAAGPDEDQFLRALNLSGVKYACVVGGDTFLDRQYSQHAEAIKAELRFGQSPFRPQPETSHGVIGDFLITVKLARQVREELSRVYAEVRQAKDVPVGVLSELFSRQVSASLAVERGTARMQKMRKGFIEFFGTK